MGTPRTGRIRLFTHSPYTPQRLSGSELGAASRGVSFLTLTIDCPSPTPASEATIAARSGNTLHTPPQTCPAKWALRKASQIDIRREPPRPQPLPPPDSRAQTQSTTQSIPPQIPGTSDSLRSGRTPPRPGAVAERLEPACPAPSTQRPTHSAAPRR